MRKFLLFFLFVTLIFTIMACNPKDELSLEDQIRNVFMTQKIAYDSLWHIEIKGNIVICFYEVRDSLSIALIKYQDGKWEWVAATGAISLSEGGYVATADVGVPFYLTVVVSPEEIINNVKIKDEYAKLVGIAPDKRFWFSITEEPTTRNDIEIIEH